MPTQMLTTLILIRGLPGSGKTAFSKRFATCGSRYAADDYFTQPDGSYKFNPDKLKEAHAECLALTRAAMRRKVFSGGDIVVHNTFSQRWELQPYLDLAKKYAEHNTQVHVIDLYDGGLSDTELHARCIHDVPIYVIMRMRERWEHDWALGSPEEPNPPNPADF